MRSEDSLCERGKKGVKPGFLTAFACNALRFHNKRLSNRLKTELFGVNIKRANMICLRFGILIGFNFANARHLHFFCIP